MTDPEYSMGISDQGGVPQQSQKKFGQLQLLFELAASLNSAEETGEIYHAAARGLMRAVGADRAAVIEYDSDNVMRFRAWIGLSERYRAAMLERSHWPQGARDAQPFVIADVLQDPSLSPFHEAFESEGIRSVAVIPLLGSGGPFGKVVLYYTDPHDFGAEELQIAQTIAAHVAFVTERRQTETALRASEERFRAIFLQAAVGIAQTSLDWQWLLLNDRFCEILGYTQAELRRKNLVEVTHPDDLAKNLAARRQMLAGEISSWSTEKRYVGKEGAIVWAKLNVSLVRSPDGQPQYFIAVVEDITERIRAENALRESERCLSLARGAARLGVWDADLNTNTTTFSGDYASLYGLPNDHPPLAHNEWIALVHPADRDLVESRIRESIEQTRVFDTEFRVVWPDGSVHWLLGKGTVFLDSSGRPIRMAGVNLDITARKQADAALLESEARFRNMADTAPVMIWVTGPDKLATFFNKRWLEFKGSPIEQEMGLGWVEGVHPDDQEACMATYFSAFETQSSFQTEKRLRRADGEYRWLLCTGVPRFTEGSGFAGYIGCSIDVTELKRTREQALARQKLESLGVLAGGIAHDFNNLLGSVLADSELLLGDLAVNSPARDGLERIQSVAVRGAEIVRELMAYAGQENTILEPVDISGLVGEMLELLKVSISKLAKLEVTLPEKLPAVRANAAQIRQVVMNLVTNASEALGEDEGIISVSVARFRGAPDGHWPNLSHGDYLRLEVSDTGCGMAEETQAKIFDPFFTTKFPGRGLGLAAVQGIIRDHGGTITVASMPGRGSRFEILLPCGTASAGDRRDLAVFDTAIEVGCLAATVLVVEDEETLRQAVSKMLRKAGFTIIEAANGVAGVDLYRARAPEIDAVLLDLTLPGMSGRDVLGELRRIQPNVKVVLTSAYSRDHVVSTSDELQCCVYIRKPYHLLELTSLLQNVCSDKWRMSGQTES